MSGDDVEALMVSEKVVEDWGVDGAFEICGQSGCCVLDRAHNGC